MPKTFFSYSRTDAAYTRKLATDLRAAGADLWIDQLDIQPGVRWDAAIETALKDAQALIVMLSPNAVASENIMDEVSYALENNKKVIPVIIEHCELPFRLKRLQYISFVESYEEGFKRLCSVLNLSAQSADPTAPITEKEPLLIKTAPAPFRPKAGTTPAETATENKTAVRQKQLQRRILLGAGIAALLAILYFSINHFTSKGKGELVAEGDSVETVQSDVAEATPEFKPGLYKTRPDVNDQIYLFRFDPETKMVIMSESLDTNSERIGSAATWLTPQHYNEFNYTVSGDTIAFKAGQHKQEYNYSGIINSDGTITVHVKDPEGIESSDKLTWLEQ